MDTQIPDRPTTISKVVEAFTERAEQAGLEVSHGDMPGSRLLLLERNGHQAGGIEFRIAAVTFDVWLIAPGPQEHYARKSWMSDGRPVVVHDVAHADPEAMADVVDRIGAGLAEIVEKLDGKPSPVPVGRPSAF